jgi:molybdopterin-binding protein
MSIWLYRGAPNRGGKRDEAQCAQPDQGEGRRGAEGSDHGHVRIAIGNGVVITSSITNEAIDDLALNVGDDAIAVIKASDVMVAK